MTRTERNQYPAALLKDKHSRSGLTKSDTQHKQGAGAHNWGSIRQEGDYENQAQADAAGDEGMFDMEAEEGVGALPSTPKKMQAQDEEEGISANKDFMKEAIATSPTDSMASLDSNVQVNKDEAGNSGAGGMKGRRMSNVSDEERERARVYREGVMAQGGPVNLANIARTSFGVASPPNGNGFAGMAGTSPTKSKTFA